jgi:hypothetical protein
MKYLLLLVPVFIWLEACSQSPDKDAAKQSKSILTDTSGNALGDSPNKAFRLFKFTHQEGDKSMVDLKLLRLQDLQETLVSTITVEAGGAPKVYWSKDSRYLITENNVQDSLYGREMVLFDLVNFNVAKRKAGRLINFDTVNDIAFIQRYNTERQIICFFDVKDAELEHRREVLAPQEGKLPVILFVPLERKAKVKLYTTGGAAVNISFLY